MFIITLVASTVYYITLWLLEWERNKYLLNDDNQRKTNTLTERRIALYNNTVFLVMKEGTNIIVMYCH